MRDIGDILHFRGDISPFLCHLTRGAANGTAPRSVLEDILGQSTLKAGRAPLGDAKYGINTVTMEEAVRRRFFGAVCFTETPLAEVHCLLEIDRRQVELAPYGLVFLKDRLMARGVAPALYINNCQGDQDPTIRALCGLIATSPQAAEQILPLLCIFGQQLRPPGAAVNNNRIDFRWEREWRYAVARGDLLFSHEDVFVGLCPHEEIEDFERNFPPLVFIDPVRSMKWYATQLIAARQRLDIKYSVV